jgi:hypothetical protein
MHSLQKVRGTNVYLSAHMIYLQKCVKNLESWHLGSEVEGGD